MVRSRIRDVRTDSIGEREVLDEEENSKIDIQRVRVDPDEIRNAD